MGENVVIKKRFLKKKKKKKHTFDDGWRGFQTEQSYPIQIYIDVRYE